jgi:hypothetical protein
MAANRKQAGEPKKAAKLDKPTLVHFSFYCEQDIVSATVQQDVTILDETERTGRDVRMSIDDLPKDVQTHLSAAFDGIAKHLSADSAQK